MTTVAEIKEAITQLPLQELAELRAWYDEYEAELWDKQIEADARAGRLDHLAEEAIRSFRSGQTQRYHDLDALAGTWSEEEADEFLQAVEDFNKVDSHLWQ